ncbi:MAG: hypothetical protein AAB223_05045, partial [Pseudomonadota bacterium]
AVAAALAALLWAVRSPGALADSAGAWQAYQTGKYAPAVKELAALAESGDANAQFYLGTLYSDGLAVKRDYRTAIEWHGKAAAKGHGDAEFTLGLLYLSGAGEGAGAAAQYEMGRLKTQSLAVESWGEAYTWFRLAEKQSYPGANESRLAVAKQIDPKTLAEAERRADMFVPRK